MIWWILFTIVLLTQSACVMAAHSPAFDIRVTSAEDLIRYKTTIAFENPVIKDYNNIEVYPKDQAVYVSAPNNVLKLSYRNGLTLTERYRWRPKPTDVEECQKKGRGLQDCAYNHIKILLLFNGTQSRRKDAIFICGTVGRNPECTERSTQNMTEAMGPWGGQYRCPYNPKSSVTALMASDGYLYLGTSTDYASREFSILRRNQSRGGVNKPELFTRRNDDRYLMDPVFVSSHEVGNYVYFFFHETSYESYTSCNQKFKVSRVARVCKDDPGSVEWGRKSIGKWTTFLKARMICRKVGAPDDLYNEITSTFIDVRKEYLYAVFTSSRYGPPGSILCRYRVSELENIFNSNYKMQHKIRHKEWVEVENRGIMGCPKTGDPDRNARSALAIRHQLVSGIYRNDRMTALTRDGERWTKVVATSVRRPRGKKHHRYAVLFIATNTGVVLKVSKIRRRTFCVVEIIEVEKGAMIKDLALVIQSEQSFLIATAASKIVRIALHRCERFATQPLCVGARDPFCGWDRQAGVCVNVAGQAQSSRFRQDLRDCPRPVRLLDGAWSSWGPWTTCSQVVSTGREQQCRCRQRSCSRPPPMLGGHSCRGPSIQVTNCTVDGGWSDWSTWSPCSSTCGYSRQYRVRRCDSPRPSLSGRRCRGRNEESRQCETPPCPPPTPMPVHGGWSPWSSWNECTVPCNTGFRKRLRVCNNPEPRDAGSPCYGASWEYEKCNEQPCPETEKLSQWTGWVHEAQGPDLRGSGLQNTKIRMTRYRFVCVARVPNETLMSTKVTSEQQYCESSGKCRNAGIPKSSGQIGRKGVKRRKSDRSRSSVPFSPSNDAFLVKGPVLGIGIDSDGGWSQWSAWSPCSLSCGGGRQHRSRQCDSPAPRGKGRPCINKGIDWRPCNVGPCVAGGSWSCWSDWTRCDCGNNNQDAATAMRTRSRQCRTNDGLNAIGCPGKQQEEQECDETQCFSEGWSQWTPWSLCRGGQKLRTRQCRHSKRSFCRGLSEEQSSCKMIGASERPTGQFDDYELAIVAVVTFLVGALLSAIVTLLYCHNKQRRLERSLNTPPRRHRSRSAPAEPSDSLARSMGISDLQAGPPGSALESDSLMPWQQQCLQRPSFLDRQHSFHGTTTTSLGRSNVSSVRTPGKIDSYMRWPAHVEPNAFAYTTMPRLPSHCRLSSTSTASRVPAWGLDRDQDLVLPINARRRGSEHDSVFLPAAQPAESRQLLSNRYRVGE